MRSAVNLTAEDAYFSGMAADFDDAKSFQAAFLERLDSLANEQPIVKRYREKVIDADPVALWQLGCDARHFSEENTPGEKLLASAEAVYLYNPANLPEKSLEWLKAHHLPRIQMDNATH